MAEATCLVRDVYCLQSHRRALEGFVDGEERTPIGRFTELCISSGEHRSMQRGRHVSTSFFGKTCLYSLQKPTSAAAYGHERSASWFRDRKGPDGCRVKAPCAAVWGSNAALYAPAPCFEQTAIAYRRALEDHSDSLRLRHFLCGVNLIGSYDCGFLGLYPYDL